MISRGKFTAKLNAYPPLGRLTARPHDGYLAHQASTYETAAAQIRLGQAFPERSQHSQVLKKCQVLSQ
jgi:hypothetical protein